MSMIEIKGLCKSFGDHEVLKGIDQNVDEGEVLCIVGPSGSGKTTCLNIVGGMDSATSGQVIVDGKEITGLHRRELKNTGVMT